VLRLATLFWRRGVAFFNTKLIDFLTTPAETSSFPSLEMLNFVSMHDACHAQL
jgi:hypothetical protein